MADIQAWTQLEEVSHALKSFVNGDKVFPFCKRTHVSITYALFCVLHVCFTDHIHNLFAIWEPGVALNVQRDAVHV